MAQNMRDSDLIKSVIEKPIITPMQSTDFIQINQWCIDEGWNIGIYDSDIYYKIDPTGHYICKTTNNIASLSLIKHSPYFFTLGPFIVHKLHRKLGIGEAMLNATIANIEHEHPKASTILFSVPEQIERYKRVGFIPCINIQRWYIKSKETAYIKNECRTITKPLIPYINQYYQQHHIVSREIILNELLLKPETNGLVYIDNNIIKGFGFIRRCIRGFRIGALIADTPAIAQELIDELLVFAHSEPAFIDVPCSNPDASRCMNALNAQKAATEDTIMMMKGTDNYNYLKNFDHHYGLFSLEIG